MNLDKTERKLDLLLAAFKFGTLREVHAASGTRRHRPNPTFPIFMPKQCSAEGIRERQAHDTLSGASHAFPAG